MARNKKIFLSGSLIEVSFRTEKGLPLVCNPIMRLILRSILVRAQEKYNQISLNHFIVMGNHLHMLMIVRDASHVTSFVEYFKRESAHAINRLKGIRKEKVWEEGFSAPIILDIESAKARICYFYTNPERDGLEIIDNYPNLSSWKYWDSKSHVIKAGILTRDQIMKLPNSRTSLNEDRELTLKLAKNSKKLSRIEFSLDDWMQCFGIHSDEQKRTINLEIRGLIKVEENRIRKSDGYSLIGAKKLTRQSIFKYHRPKKHGHKQLCLGSSIEERRSYIVWYKEQDIAFEEAMARVILQPQSVYSLPPGMFLPGGILLANCVVGIFKN